ncbi:uncharacterized protein LOC119464020 [Dermacentor silvarum]|uniref:uncharacterized protein LOC119464020 n=1 Tax=Dermacentor silvarum TaxID=543639 RepID=UPI001896B7F9|nr:uncharacterized protein LOC119464020 [Dermacentor silvarum]
MDSMVRRRDPACFIKIPRCVRDGLYGAVEKAELHIFIDASPNAYGACAYLRTVDDGGNTATSLIVAKSRVAPTEILTLPKLELMATVAGARLLKYIRSSWDSTHFPCIMWTDTTSTLSCIRGDYDKLGQFVKHRVAEIVEAADPLLWRYCPGEDKP